MRLVRLFAIVIVVAIAFCAGFFVRGVEPIMSRLDLPFSSTDTKTATTTKTTYDSVSARVSEVEDILKASSYDTYDLDKATSQSISALLGCVDDDAYLHYFDEASYEVYSKENASTDYSGIGVLFAEYEGKTYAADVFPGSVADIEGVEEGDFVESINGASAESMTASEVINSVSEGQEIVISWRRPDTFGASGGDTFTTTLKSQGYKQPNVVTSLDEGGQVGTISIAQFNQNAADNVKAAIDQLGAQGAKAYVLDLRNCSGGYLTVALDIASLFVPSGTLAQIQTKNGISTKTASGNPATTAPLVVLINEKTAASAEVLAAALRDNGVAKLVGTTTMGKGSIQVTQKLSFGGAIRYTAAYYLSPEGHAIDKQGVSPDIPISEPEAQDVVALQTAQSEVATP